MEQRELLDGGLQGEGAVGFLQGLSYHDVNQNGLFDPNEPRLPGATVQLFRGQTLLGTRTTAADGTYLFDNLDPGNYTLVQLAPAGFWESAAEARSQIYPATVTQPNRINVTLVDPNRLSAETPDDPDDGPNGPWPARIIPQEGVILFGQVPEGFQRLPEFPDLRAPVGFIDVTVTRGGVQPPTTIVQTLCAELTPPARFFPGLQFQPTRRSDPIGYLTNRYGTRTDLTPEQEAGLQFAVWELTYDVLWQPAPNPADLTAGNFRYVAQQAERPAILAAGNAFLAEAVGKSEIYLYLDTVDPLYQNFTGSSRFDFGNQRLAALEGSKWHDVNANSQWDVGEPGLGGWTIQVLQNNTTVATRTTGSDGRYRVENLLPGTYQIREVLQAGWFQSYPSAPGTHTVTLVSGQNLVAPALAAVAPNFGNYQNGSAAGRVLYRQPDCTEMRERGGQAGVEVVLERQVGGQFQLVATAGTTADGSYSFGNLTPATYRVRQVVQGWTELSAPPGTFTIVSGQARTGLDFRNELPLDPNARCGTLSGRVTQQVPTCTEPQDRGGRQGITVYLDANNNSQLDDGETRTVTNASGDYTFGPLGVGTYRVRYVLPPTFKAVGRTSYDVTQTTPIFSVAGLDFRLEVPPGAPLNCIPIVNDKPQPPFPTNGGVTPPVLINDLGGKSQLLASTISQSGQTGDVLSLAAYVTGLYRNILNRAPDNGGLVTWVQQLQGGVSRSLVVSAIYNSVEHRGNQVDFYYNAYLGRLPDAAGRAGWVSALVNGMTEKDLLSRLIASEEYYVKSRADNGVYVSRLYAQLLGRQPEAAGHAAWVQVIQGATSRFLVAQSFLNAREVAGKVLDSIYTDYLGRGVDPAGREAWQGVIGRGQMSWAEVARAVLASDEYFNRLHNLAKNGR